MPQKYVLFTEAIPDVRWIGFVGFLIGLVELIQDSFAVVFARSKLMGIYVCFQPLFSYPCRHLLARWSFTSSSLIASGYLPCTINLLRKWSKPWSISRYSDELRTNILLGCFIHRSTPSTRPLRHGCGYCSSAAPIPFDWWFSAVL